MIFRGACSCLEEFPDYVEEAEITLDDSWRPRLEAAMEHCNDNDADQVLFSVPEYALKLFDSDGDAIEDAGIYCEVKVDADGSVEFLFSVDDCVHGCWMYFSEYLTEGVTDET